MSSEQDLSHLDMETRELVAEVAVGLDAEAFIDSTTGRLLVGRARAVAEAATEQLKSCDPHDWKLVQKLQCEIRQAENFELWLRDAILNGRNAESQLHQMESFE